MTNNMFRAISGGRALVICMGLPWLIDANKCSEYATVKNLISINGINIVIEEGNAAVISIISLRRLIEGGAAMFAHTIRNHHMDRMGQAASRPLVNAILRVCVYS